MLLSLIIIYLIVTILVFMRLMLPIAAMTERVSK